MICLSPLPNCHLSYLCATRRPQPTTCRLSNPIIIGLSPLLNHRLFYPFTTWRPLPMTRRPSNPTTARLAQILNRYPSRPHSTCHRSLSPCTTLLPSFMGQRLLASVTISLPQHKNHRPSCPCMGHRRVKSRTTRSVSHPPAECHHLGYAHRRPHLRLPGFRLVLSSRSSERRTLVWFVRNSEKLLNARRPVWMRPTAS